MTENSPINQTNLSLVLPISSDIFLFYKRFLIQFYKMRNKNSLDDIITIFKKYLEMLYSKIFKPACAKYFFNLTDS